MLFLINLPFLYTSLIGISKHLYSSHLFGQRWHFVGSIVDLLLTSDIWSPYFPHRANVIANGSMLVLSSPTGLAKANVMLTIPVQVLRWETLVRHNLKELANFDSLDKFYSRSFMCFLNVI